MEAFALYLLKAVIWFLRFEQFNLLFSRNYGVIEITTRKKAEK